MHKDSGICLRKLPHNFLIRKCVQRQIDSSLSNDSKKRKCSHCKKKNGKTLCPGTDWEISHVCMLVAMAIDVFGGAVNDDLLFD